MSPSRLVVVLALSFFLSNSPASAQWTWSTTAATGNWGTNTNWVPATVPTSAFATDLMFGASPITALNNNIANPFQLNSLTFTSASAAYSITGGTFQFGGGPGDDPRITNNSSSTINFPNAGQIDIQFATGPNGFVVDGAGMGNVILHQFANGNNISLTHAGAGTVTLADAVMGYTGFLGGITSVTGGGTLALGHGTALPTGKLVVLENGSTLNLGSFRNDATTAPGTIVLDSSTLRIPSGSGSYFASGLTTGSLGGTLNMTGAGSTVLRLTGATSQVSVSSGGNNFMWIGATTAGVQQDNASDMTMSIGTASTLTSDLRILAGSQGRGFNITGGGTLRLNNTSNTADFTVSGSSSVAVSNMAALGSGIMTLSQGKLVYDGATASSNKPVTLDLAGFIGVSTAASTLTLSGTLSQSISGAGLQVNGAGTLELTGSNTYAGLTAIVNNSILSIPTFPNGGVAGPLGMSSSASSNLSLGGFNLGGGTLRYTGPTTTTDRGMTLTTSSATTNFNVIEVANAATNLTITGQLFGNYSGSGALFKTGPGTLTLSNSTNIYTHYTTVAAGRLSMGANGGVIPGGTTLYVEPGAEFNVNGFENGVNNILNFLVLTAGNLRAPSGSGFFYVRNLISNSGGAVDMSGSGGGYGLALTAITVNNSAIWTGPGRIFNVGSGEAQLTIAAGATLTNSLDLNTSSASGFVIVGGGTLYQTSIGNGAPIRLRHGTLRVDDVATNGNGALSSGALTFDGGTLQYSGPTAASTKSMLVLELNGTINVSNAATTLTLDGAFFGPGTLTKTGPGTMILGNPNNSNTAGFIIGGGRLDVPVDANLGIAQTLTVNAGGSVRYTASQSTARTFNLNAGSFEVPTGVNLTLNGATVNGGFLRGAGTYTLTGGTTLTGVTTFTSTTMNVTGSTSAANFTNNGAVTVNSGQTFDMNYATNASAGRMTINGTANVSDFVSNGQINVPVGGTLNNSASPSGIVLGGGSTTFIGTAAVPGGLINVGSQPMLVRGGLLVNNGAIGNSSGTGQVIVDYGGFAKGTGYYDTLPQTINGGRFSPGNSPGRVTVGSVNMTPGGIYDFEINNATGLAGPTGTTNLSGWDLTIVSNQINPNLSNLTVSATSATPFTINLVTLTNPSPPDVPGQMANFNATQPFQWLAFDVNPAGSVVNWDPSAIVVNTSQFMNTFNGTFSLVRDTGNPFQFHISYTPVPEPVTVLAVAFGGLIVGGAIRRRRATKKT